MDISEQIVQNLILDYLGHLSNSYPLKIEISGKKTYVNGVMKMIPFKNKYHRKGCSDILLCYEGKFYCFEVKKESEYLKIKKNYNRISTTPIKLLPEYLHRAKRQMNFIEDVRRAGGLGDFVCSLDQVRLILEGVGRD